MSSPTSESLNTINIFNDDKIIKAAAGTGKTYTLTELSLQLAKDFYQKNQRLPRFVISTFTRKATEELKERITQRVLEDDQQLFGLIQSKSHLHISTIHGVLAQFLRKYGHNYGIESGFNIVDEDQSSQLLESLIYSFLAKDINKIKYEKLLQRFQFSQITEALDKIYEFQFIYSEARCARAKDQKKSMSQFIKDASIACQKALEPLRPTAVADPKWGDYVSSLKLLLGEASDLDLGTIKAFADRLSNISRPRFSKKCEFSSEANLHQQKTVKDFSDMLAKSVQWYSRLDEYDESNSLFSDLAVEILPQFIERKKNQGVLDSRDLEIFSFMALKEEPELGQDFAQDWDFWMIDEFQDTSPLQIALIEKLRGRSPIQYVGDPQQSIYLFRGARVEIFDGVHKKIVTKNGPQKELIVNRRSSPEALHAINEVLSHMGKQFQQMQALAEVIDPKKKTLSVRLEDEEQPTYRAIIDHILELKKSGSAFSDICILGRTKKDLLRISEALQAFAIPTNIHVSEGFYSRREVLDIVAMIKFLINPYDDQNLFTLLRSPYFYLEDQLLVSFHERRTSAWHFLKSNHDQHKVYLKLVHLYDGAKTHGIYQSLRNFLLDSNFFSLSKDLDPSLRREANVWKFLEILRESERTSGFSYTKFLRSIEKVWKADMSDLSDAAPISEPNRVNIMTIHKSKGLSFKHIIIPHLEKEPRLAKSRAHEFVIAFDEVNKIWSSFTFSDEQKKLHSPALIKALMTQDLREQEESLRLLYVAVTRAEESLMLHAVEKKSVKTKGFSDKSWASLFPFWFEAGCFERKTHSLVVSHGPWECLPFEAKLDPGLTVRPIYQASSLDLPLQRFSVSSLLEANDKDIHGSVSNHFNSLEDRKSFIYAPGLGTQLHNSFEKLKYFSKDEVLNGLADKQELQQAVNWTLSLEDPPMSSIITHGEVEWGFQVKTPHGILEGQIDLWGLVDETCWLVDYKSGSSKHSAKAFQQLQYYAYAISKFYRIKSFKLVVLYPLQQTFSIEYFELDTAKFEKQFSLL